MAKTESTAVNELIGLVQNGKSTAQDPAGDLLFDERPPAPTRIQPPRVTTTVPAMRGAGEVAPLPPKRAPQSTATHQQVRMRTASPTRGTTIPPLGRASSPPPVPSRTSSQQVVAPRGSSADVSARPLVPSRTTSSHPAVTIPPRTTGSHQAVSPPPIPSRTKTPSQQIAAPVPSRTKTPSQQIVAPPQLDEDDDDMDWDAATQATMPKSGPVAKPPTAFADIDDAETPVTHSSPTLPSPRVTQPSFPALPKPRPTLPMPRQSAPKLPPPRSTPRASEPPPIGQPFAARSLMNEVSEPTPTDVDIDVEITPELKPAAKPARAKSEPPAPWEATLAPLVVDPNTDVSAKIAANDSTWVGKPATQSSSLARKLVIPAVAATLIGVGVGAYLATQTKKSQSAPASTTSQQQQFTPPSAPAVAMPETPSPAPSPMVGAANPQPTVEAAAPEQAAEPSLTHDVPVPAPEAVAAPAPEALPAPETTAKITFVDIRIDSKPAGATAVLVDNGKTSFLGTTPLATSLDSSRAYDIVFTYDDRPTQMVHVDPAKQTRVEVSMPRASSSSHHHRAPAPAAAVAATTPAPAPAPKAAAKQAAPAADAGGEGTLMISSKPPCDILIDGKPTGLTTPQRSISLSAGNHKVTLVNEGEKIKKTVSVTITADKPTKLIQDLMQH